MCTDSDDRKWSVMLVNLPELATVGPIPTLGFAVFRRAFQLIPRDVDDVTSDTFVVFQHRPGQGVVIVAHTEKTAKGEHGVGYTTTQLVDHDVFDSADLVPIGPIDRRSFDFIACYQV